MIRPLLLLAACFLSGCGLLAFDASRPPTALERAASDFTIAWVEYDTAGNDEEKSAALVHMADILVGADNLLGVAGVSDVVPQPGVIILVSKVFPGASAAEVAFYAKVLTVLLRPAQPQT